MMITANRYSFTVRAINNDTSIICYALRPEIFRLIGYLLIKCEISGPEPIRGHVVREGVTENKGE